MSLGLPGGLIGPTLVIGATAGGALGIVGHGLVPDNSATSGLYAILGMGAMMGAVLQAPLAALMAILELTANPNIILPGMFAIVTATLTTRVAFKQDSVFVSMLRTRGLEYRNDPVSVSLQRTGVGAVMSRQMTTTEAEVPADKVMELAGRQHEWVLVADGTRIESVLPRAALDSTAAALGELEPPDVVDLRSLDGGIDTFVTVRLQATLREALARLDRQSADLVLVTRSAVAMRNGVYGVLTRNQIESSVRYQG